MKTTATTAATAAQAACQAPSRPTRATRGHARDLPALPAGWKLAGDYYTSEDGTERYALDDSRRVDRLKIAMTLEGYSYHEHAAAWRYGENVAQINAELLALAERCAGYFELVGGKGNGLARDLRAAIARATVTTGGSAQ